MKQQDRMKGFSEEIWAWFARWKRTLPWRDLALDDPTQCAYMILVSEVMLQQTQVSRVEVIFRRFLERFPTLEALAVARNKDVILAWKGMGYNNRALRLRDAAKKIIERHDGVFPHGLEELQAMKGIGPYTAAAIRNFAFHIPTPCVDTNIHRILRRVFIDPQPEPVNAALQRKVGNLADQALKIALDASSASPAPGGTADWHAALMDFGSLVCKKNVPACDHCPLAASLCKSAFKVKQSKQDKRPSAEPGRVIGAVFVPNRIIRGRVVDALREAERGMTMKQLGSYVCIDWSANHHAWLDKILKDLIRDTLIAKKQQRYVLHEG